MPCACKHKAIHGLGRVFSFTHAAVLSSAAGAGGFALRLRKLARNASRSRSALIRSLSSASFANALLLCARRRCAARCQMASCDASRLTLSPSLRIGPHLRYCCCSSVVERVIGNDEVGSSILPSSTRKPPDISKALFRSTTFVLGRRGKYADRRSSYSAHQTRFKANRLAIIKQSSMFVLLSKCAPSAI